MIYNDGHTHDEFYSQSQQNLEKIAEEFSEGNNILKETLLALWSKGIKTNACCNGHSEPGRHPSPYISIKIDSESMLYVHELFHKLMELGLDDVEVDFSTNDTKKELYMTVHTDHSIRDSIFRIIKDTCQSQIHSNHDYDIITAVNHLNYYCNDNGLNFRLGVKHNEMQFGMAKPGYRMLFVENNIQLDDVLEDLKQTGKFWLRGYKCDIKSLKKFLSILYPTAEYFKATINEQTK